MTDVNNVPKPIEASSSQGLIDGLQALIRYTVVIVGIVSGLSAAFGEGGTVSAVMFIKDHLGDLVAAITGIVGVATMAYGVWKTWRRGAEVATVAASPKVPNSVARLKD